MRRAAGTLTDTSPLFALVDAKSQPHEFMRCEALLPALPKPLVTTWPCLSEAMHLTGREGGWSMQKLLAKYLTTGFLLLHTLSSEETMRIFQLMEQYPDTPMDLADASLVALAESAGHTRISSLDSDFYVYRLANGTALEVVPEPQSSPRG